MNPEIPRKSEFLKISFREDINLHWHETWKYAIAATDTGKLYKVSKVFQIIDHFDLKEMLENQNLSTSNTQIYSFVDKQYQL